METQTKILWGAGLLGAGLVLLLILQPRIEEELAPEPHAPHVAFEVDGSGIAEVAPQRLEVGQTFKLHAVLEARTRDGETLYYTQAKRLRIGGADVPAEQIQTWDRPRPVRVRWLTLEGSRPFLELQEGEGLSAFEIKAFLRTTWPIGWSIPGELEPANDDHLALENTEPIPFGTQHYQVQIEFYDTEQSVIPQRTLYSGGVDELRRQPDAFPAVRQTLPGAAAAASRVFGLTQLEPPKGAERELLQKIEELAQRGVAFSRLSVIREQIRSNGKTIEEVDWVPIDLSGRWGWGESVAAGDLLRAGERIVVLYADRGSDGALDGDDLCFDYVQGAAIRRLADVFSGEGVVELASLSPTSASASSPAGP